MVMVPMSPSQQHNPSDNMYYSEIEGAQEMVAQTLGDLPGGGRISALKQKFEEMRARKSAHSDSRKAKQEL